MNPSIKYILLALGFCLALSQAVATENVVELKPGATVKFESPVTVTCQKEVNSNAPKCLIKQCNLGTHFYIMYDSTYRGISACLPIESLRVLYQLYRDTGECQ